MNQRGLARDQSDARRMKETERIGLFGSVGNGQRETRKRQSYRSGRSGASSHHMNMAGAGMAVRCMFRMHDAFIFHIVCRIDAVNIMMLRGVMNVFFGGMSRRNNANGAPEGGHHYNR